MVFDPVVRSTFQRRPLSKPTTYAVLVGTSSAICRGACRLNVTSASVPVVRLTRHSAPVVPRPSRVVTYANPCATSSATSSGWLKPLATVSITHSGALHGGDVRWMRFNVPPSYSTKYAVFEMLSTATPMPVLTPVAMVVSACAVWHSSAAANAIPATRDAMILQWSFIPLLLFARSGRDGRR